MSFPLSCILSSYYSSLSLSFPTFSPLSPSLHSLRSGLRRAVVPDPPPRVEGGEGHCGPPPPRSGGDGRHPTRALKEARGQGRPRVDPVMAVGEARRQRNLARVPILGDFFQIFACGQHKHPHAKLWFFVYGCVTHMKNSNFRRHLRADGQLNCMKNRFWPFGKKTFLVVVTLFFYKVRKFKEVWLRKIKS